MFPLPHFLLVCSPFIRLLLRCYLETLPRARLKPHVQSIEPSYSTSFKPIQHPSVLPLRFVPGQVANLRDDISRAREAHPHRGMPDHW